MDLLERLSCWAMKQGDLPALAGPAQGAAGTITYQSLWQRSDANARQWLLGGLQAGATIAILAESCSCWGLALISCWRAGAIVAPMDTSLGSEDLLRHLTSIRPQILIVSPAFAARARHLASALPHPMQVVLLDELASIPATGSHDAQVPTLARFPDTEPALIIHTSGSVGNPKGVVLTHGNLRFQLEAGTQAFRTDSQTVAVSILPLHHVFELTVGLLGVLYIGGRVQYCPSLLPAEIQATLRRERPTAMVMVPMVLVLIRDGILRTLQSSPGLRSRLFHRLRELSRWLPSFALRRALFKPLHTAFGGQLRFFICGGAPLSSDVRQFFEDIGIAVYQGYGLTECSPIVTTNSPEANRPGSVGRPLPGVELRCIGSSGGSGEIQTRGPHVMRGYLGQPTLTAEVLDNEGWLHTGDLGHIDADGFLYVAGRLDDLIVLDNGKKVYPEELEPTLTLPSSLGEIAVLGATRKSGARTPSREVCLVVVPAAPDTGNQIHLKLRELAQGLAAYKRPTRILMRKDALPRTAAGKLRRQELQAWVDSQDQ